MQNEVVVILGTGGTIAGTANTQGDHTGYTAAQLSVQALVDAVPALGTFHLLSEQVAQVDSKDMSHAIWRDLAQRVQAYLDRPEVAGVVITHGTDTLEETACFLSLVLAPRKPVVLTAAMRPATALQADGPQNLLDAATVARDGARHGLVGVMTVVAGEVLSALEVRKVHTYRLNAFESVHGSPLARVMQGQIHMLRAATHGSGDPSLAAHTPWLPLADLLAAARGADDWPWVALVFNHAGADGAVVDALLQHAPDGRRLRGLVVGTTGNGTIGEGLARALADARAQGVVVWHATRCAYGPLLGGAAHVHGALSPWQLRVALMLELMRTPA